MPAATNDFHSLRAFLSPATGFLHESRSQDSLSWVDGAYFSLLQACDPREVFISRASRFWRVVGGCHLASSFDRAVPSLALPDLILSSAENRVRSSHTSIAGVHHRRGQIALKRRRVLGWYSNREHDAGCQRDYRYLSRCLVNATRVEGSFTAS